MPFIIKKIKIKNKKENKEKNIKKEEE